MLLVDYIFKQVAWEDLTQKRSKKEEGERVSHVDIQEESITSRKNSKCKDLELCSVTAVKKRVLVTDVCVSKYMCTIMRDVGLSFTQGRSGVPKGTLKCIWTNL